MSGGRATVGKKQGKIRETQAGDITALAAKGIGAKAAHMLTDRYVIECKCVKSLEMHRLIPEGKGFIKKTWNEASKICHDLNYNLNHNEACSWKSPHRYSSSMLDVR